MFLTFVFRFCRSIDNGPIQCEHGKVPVSKLTSMKRLSAAAWQKLFSKVRKSAVPDLHYIDFCLTLLKLVFFL
jgi:ubiquitin carboxyl-terminal hydrolase 48